ncbi:MAG: iron-containing alcohol dehydrogenase [Candidatus Bathyarchaeota archaeon]|nr:iron-containing alcohol dehydrogenase [Candidatus Bathyarchaeum sp.]
MNSSIHMMNLWSCYLPTKILFGVNSIGKLAEITESFNPKKILLVTGKQSMKQSGVTKNILDQLGNRSVVVYDNATHNPTVDDVEDGKIFLEKEEADLVIALGGGSVIDFAKAIAILANNTVFLSNYLHCVAKIANKGIPVIAIPTTSGTGSEVTQYASIVDANLKKKLSLTSDFIRPEVAIIDPNLTLTMPKFVTATTGLDALSQCIESYWSKNRTPVSDLFAIEGVKLVFENLVGACNFPEDLTFRRNMALASLFSGLAISITKTTIVHAVSYPLTVFFDVPHGLACSFTLPSFIQFNSEVLEERMLRLAKMVGTDTIDIFVQKVKQLILDVALPTLLSEVGIKREDIDLIINEGFRPDRAANNPREVTPDELRAILSRIL